MDLPDHVDELSVLMSRPSDIEAFLRALARYDAVMTSAMHVMTACQSYGIPCGLITFEGFEDRVHGSGIKYEDYALGAEVDVVNPQVVGLDLRQRDLVGPPRHPRQRGDEGRGGGAPARGRGPRPGCRPRQGQARSAGKKAGNGQEGNKVKQ